MCQKGMLKHDVALQTMKDVQIFWEKVKIFARSFKHAVQQLEDLVRQFEALKKNKG